MSETEKKRPVKRRTEVSWGQVEKALSEGSHSQRRTETWRSDSAKWSGFQRRGLIWMQVVKSHLEWVQEKEERQ